MSKEETLTQQRLKELFHYNPETGLFLRLKTVASRAKKGDIAGCLRVQDGYLQIYIDYNSFLAHRLAFFYMLGFFPQEIDHINHIRNDNRWGNLRSANSTINGRNSSISKKNSSGVTGVNWDKTLNKWRARIKVDYKDKHLGFFDKLEDAIACRKSANKLYGFHENHGSPF